MLSWGKCTIWIGKLGEEDAAPSEWTKVPTPVENSTVLTATKGDKTEAKVEGGEVEAVKYGKNTYSLAFNIRAAKGRKKPVEDKNGTIDGNYAVKLQPEDPTVEGLDIKKATLSMLPSFSTADGTIWQYTADVLLPEDGSDAIDFVVIEDPSAMG